MNLLASEAVDVKMGKRYILSAVLLASLPFFIQSDAVEYTCTLDNSTTYEYPATCSLRTSSGNNNSEGNSSVVTESSHDLRGYDEELEGVASPGPPHPVPPHPPHPSPPSRCEVTKDDIQVLKCCWKFEYVRVQYLASAVGLRLQDIDSSLMMNGTLVGAQRAFLSQETQTFMESMLYATVDQMKTLKLSIGANDSVEGMNLNIGHSRCAALFDKAFGVPLFPKFDCYRDDMHAMLTLYWFNALVTKCYIGILEKMEGPKGARLSGSLAATKASQEILIRGKLFDQMEVSVHPYFITIADFTNKLAMYADSVMGTSGCSDEGLEVPECLSTGGKWKNLFSLDDKGLPYGMVVDSTCLVANVTLSDFIHY